MSTHIEALKIAVDPGPVRAAVDIGGGDLLAVELAVYRGIPVHLDIQLALADCWVDGHVLTLEIVGPDGARVAPGRRVLLGAGHADTGTITVSTRLGFLPQQVGPHALYVHLDRRGAVGVRFLVREPRR